MDHLHIGTSTPARPLRLWPGVAAVVVQWLALVALPAAVPGTGVVGLLTGLAAGLVVFAWWLFFSRVGWVERLAALVLMVAGVWAASPVVHPSIATGMMGMMLPMYSIPALSVALVAWAVAARRIPGAFRRPALVAAIIFACALLAVLRTDGVMGEGTSQFHWRWTPTAEERLLARPGDEPLAAPLPAPPAVPQPAVAPAQAPVDAGVVPTSLPAATDAAAGASAVPAEWPGFRGPRRDSVVHGARIDTDWTRVQPRLLWRRPVGPGWSSFAVRGDLFYTQEQRGDEEIVACYRVSTGQPVWRHKDAARFYESNGGAGPRGTPTLSGARVYAMGATGVLNALDAGSGQVQWTRNVSADSGVAVPMWGFASSPLVVDGLAIVAAAGRLMAYNLADGTPKWSGPVHGGGYSSPHLVTVDGVRQVVLLSDVGATSVSPADGAVLWEHAWPGSAIVQPASTDTGDILVSSVGQSGGLGMRRVSATRGEHGWSTSTRWTTTGLKPYFNDLVVHEGHAYGIDGGILSCIDLDDGKRVWKGGRYGYGQLLLLADQDLLLVLSEEGELALVDAAPGQFREVTPRVAALSGKTWNHPALVGDTLLVRNGEEMAAFRLPRAAR